MFLKTQEKNIRFYFYKVLINKISSKFYSSLKGISYLASNGKPQKINEFVTPAYTNDMQNSL